MPQDPATAATGTGSTRSLRRRMALAAAVIGILLLGAYAFMSWFAAGSLLTPKRKPLNANHREWLDHPQKYGMRLTKGITSRRVPYLLCRPDPAAGPSTRGRLLRSDLADTAQHAPEFGVEMGTVVLIHGWGGRKEDFIPVAERFCAVGFRCILPDLPAHGENPERRLHLGRGKMERSLARDVLQSAAAEFQFPSTPAAVWGISLGGSYAIQAAKEDPDLWKGIVVVSSFDSLSPVLYRQARRRFKNMGPVLTFGAEQAIWLRTGRSPRDVRPARMLRNLQMPVMVIHGTDDPVIAEQQGRRLFDAVPHQQKRWISVPGARHGNALNEAYAEMAGWYLYSFQLARGNAHAAAPIPATPRPPSTTAKTFAVKPAPAAASSPLPVPGKNHPASGVRKNGA